MEGVAGSHTTVFDDDLYPWMLSSDPAQFYTDEVYLQWLLASETMLFSPLIPPPVDEEHFIPTTLTWIPQSDNHSTVSKARKRSTSATIDFWVGERQGIRLIDALQGNVVNLIDSEHEVMNAASAKVSYKVEWLGYDPLSRQKYAQRVRGVQNRGKVAKQVAEVVSQFVLARANQPTAHPEWRIGAGSIEYENLYLMRLERVSKSTWIPLLAYAH